MSDPARLFDDTATDMFERTLLRSAALDREPEDGATRALAALGLATAAVGAAGTSATVHTAKVAGASITTKIGALVLATGALVGGIAAIAASEASDTKTPAGTSMAVAAPSFRASSGALSATLAAPAPVPEVQTVSVAELPPAPPSSAGSTLAPSVVGRPPQLAALRSATTEPASRARPSIADEIAAIDEARAAMAAGDTARAGRALDAYDARFGHGALFLEAKLARIELHLARAEHAQARALCERFLVEHPQTAYDKRVLALLERARSTRAIPQ